MFLAARNIQYDRPPFKPSDILGLMFETAQNKKFKYSVGNVLNHSEVLEIFYFGTGRDNILQLFDEALSPTLSLKIIKGNNLSCVELLLRERRTSPTLQRVEMLELPDNLIIRLTINFKEDVIHLEMNDITVIYEDASSGLSFRGKYLQEHRDFVFPNSTMNEGELIIYNKSISLKEAENIEYYFRHTKRELP